MGLIILGIFLSLIGLIAYSFFIYEVNNTYDVRNNNTSKRKMSPKITMTIIFVPILLFTLLASITRVGTGEIAVMTRFGRVTGQELSEGLHFKNPMDKANKYDIKVLKEEAEAAAASKDLQDVNSKLVINYQLEAGKISEIHRTVGTLYKEKLIDPAIQEVFKSASAKYDATQLITDRSSVKATAYEQLKQRLEPYGIVVRDLSITNFTFSPEFTKAIEAKQVAQQQAEQAKFNAQKAEQDAQAAINRAKGEAEAQRLQQRTLTTAVLQKLFLDKWDGKLPVVTGSNNLFDISKFIKK